MISTVKETPRAKGKHDLPAELQSLGKSSVQHFYPGIINKTVAPDASRWQEAREDEDEAGNRGQPRSQSFCVGAEFCERHVVSLRLSIMRSEQPQTPAKRHGPYLRTPQRWRSNTATELRHKRCRLQRKIICGVNHRESDVSSARRVAS